MPESSDSYFSGHIPLQRIPFGKESLETAPIGLYGGSQQTDHCVTTSLDDGMLRKVPGYNGHDMPQHACTNTYHPCLCE